MIDMNYRHLPIDFPIIDIPLIRMFPIFNYNSCIVPNIYHQ